MLRQSAALLTLLLLLGVASACGGGKSAPSASPSPSATASPTEEPTVTPFVRTPTSAFEADDCWFDETYLGADVECGYVTVDADHSDPTAGEIRLAVAIFQAEGNDPQPDPLVFLDGGPGSNTLETIEFGFLYVVEPFLNDRDVIVYDQRGAGYSEPALSCPELDEFYYTDLSLGLTDEEYYAQELTLTADCRNRLEADGIDPGLANSVRSAADLEAMRIALGYEQLNLMGVSYGTRLALTTIRDFPDSIRSVILDSVYPLDADLVAETPENFDNALGRVNLDCFEDRDCRDTFPFLRTIFQGIIDELGANPVTIPGDEFTPEIILSDELLLTTIFQSFYYPETLPYIPAMIYSVYIEEYEALSVIVSQLFSDSYSTDGMYLSVQCTEEVPFSSRQRLADAISSHSSVSAAFAGDPDRTFGACDAWDVEPAPATENRGVVSDLPALILAGRYDPITPSSWGERVATRLQNSFFYEIPNSGHGAIGTSRCLDRMINRFLSDPGEGPELECYEELERPDFGLANVDAGTLP